MNDSTGAESLFRFPDARRRHPAVEAWIREHSDPLSAIAKRWFDVMRNCGSEVTEILHDGQPTACVGDAAFAYVDAFKNHVNVGFFRGSELEDPRRLLEGAGKLMRHVKLGPGRDVDVVALERLIKGAYADMRRRVKSVQTRTDPPS